MNIGGFETTQFFFSLLRATTSFAYQTEAVASSFASAIFRSHRRHPIPRATAQAFKPLLPGTLELPPDHHRCPHDHHPVPHPAKKFKFFERDEKFNSLNDLSELNECLNAC
jgi:hypothetical protein